MKVGKIPAASVNSNEALSWRRLHLSRSKLRASHSTSALLSGFALIAMIELNFEVGPNDAIPHGLFIAFGVCTTLVVVVHLMALLISTCILPHIEAVSHLGTSGAGESPHEKFRVYIELSWGFSTGLGIFLFLAELGLVAWIRFHNLYEGSDEVAIACTVILIPTLVAFVGFALFFYRKLALYHIERLKREMSTLDMEAQDFQACGIDGCNTQRMSIGNVGLQDI